MFNVVTTKKIIKSIAILAFVSIVQSCGNNSNNIDLLSQAQSAYEIGNYTLSMQLLDSLKQNSDDIEQLKKGLHLRTLNQESIIKNEIAINDSLITVLEKENMLYDGKFKYIKHKDMVEGYYVHKTIAGDAGNTERTIIEPRIDENDMFYMVSYLSGKDVKHTSVALKTKSGLVTSKTIAYDNARNYRYNSGGVTYESITFDNAQCDTLGCFIADNINSRINLVFQGKKSHTIVLNDKYKNAIAETYRCASNRIKGKAAIKKRLFLENKLKLAQKQIEQTKIID